MSSKIKGVIAGVIILILLIGAVVALKLTDKPNDSDSSSSSEVTSKLLYEKKLDDVDKIAVKNSEGEYEITRTGNEKWSVKEFEGLPMNDTFLTEVATAVSKVSSTKVIEENAEDLEKYGLTKPLADVKVTFKDSGNTVKELLLGNASPTSGQSYFAFEGEKTVYSVDTAAFSSLTQDKTSALNRVLLAAPADDNSYPRIDDMTIERANLPYKIKLVYDDGKAQNLSDSSGSTAATATDTVHKMAEPITSDLDAEKATPVIRGLYGLTAARIIAIHPTEEQLADAGINAPTAVISMKAEQDNYKLTVGKTVPESVNDVGGYYAYFDGVDMLYQFNAAALPWLTLEPMNITSPIILSSNIKDISKIDITGANINSSYELSGADDTFAVKKNGVAVDTNRFKEFYQYILRASGDSLWLNEPETAAPDVKITLSLKNGGSETLEFYNTTGRQTIIKYNGKPIYKGRTSYIERLVSNIALLDSNSEIIQVW